MSDLISVVIPVYNVQNYLNICVDSVRNQTYTNIEIILVDDGSKDDSGKICDEYVRLDSRIKVIHKENGGLSDARNYGIERATGKYITFIDSDDSVAQEYIEVLYTILIKNNAVISCVGIHYVNENGKNISPIYSSMKEYVMDTQGALGEMMYQRIVTNSACAKLFGIDLFDEIRFPVGQLYEDLAIVYKLFLKAERIVAIHRSLYHYLYRTGSISKNIFTPKQMAKLSYCEEMVDAVTNKFPQLRKKGNVRLFAGAVSIVDMIGYKGRQTYINEYDHAKNIAKQTRRYVVVDFKSSKKLWLRAILSYLPLKNKKL